MEKYIADRIENEFVIFEKEDLTNVQIRLSDLPFEVKEGSVVAFENGNYSLLESQEEERRKRIFEKQRKIFKNR